MKAMLIMGCLGLMIIFSCKNRGDFRSVKDEELEVSVIRTNKDDLIKVRILVKKYKEGLDIQSFSKSMQYNMDSCFYMLKDNHKNYPLYVTSISNGLDKTYEYLIEFEKGATDNSNLVYKDLYMSNKNIELTFN